MLRLSRGWPSRPPCPRPASQGARPVRVTPAPPARAALKRTSCHERPHAPARRRGLYSAEEIRPLNEARMWARWKLGVPLLGFWSHTEDRRSELARHPRRARFAADGLSPVIF